MVGSNLVTVFPCFTSSSSPRWGTTTGIDFDKCGDTTDSNFFRIIAPPVRLAGKGKNFNLHYLGILRTSKFKEKKLWISRYILLTDHFMNLDYNILRLGDKIVSFKPCSSPFKVWYGSITQFLFEIEAATSLLQVFTPSSPQDRSWWHSFSASFSLLLTRWCREMQADFEYG